MSPILKRRRMRTKNNLNQNSTVLSMNQMRSIASVNFINPKKSYLNQDLTMSVTKLRKGKKKMTLRDCKLKNSSSFKIKAINSDN